MLSRASRHNPGIHSIINHISSHWELCTTRPDLRPDQVPVLPDQTSVLPDQVPVLPDQVPVLPDKTSVLPDQVPGSRRDTQHQEADNAGLSPV